MSNDGKIYKKIFKFYEENIEYNVIDVLYKDATFNERHLSLKNENSDDNYLFSSIYLNSDLIFQPIYIIPHIIIDFWVNGHTVTSVLVLGCAGCTIPRFIFKRINNAGIVGIESSKKMINIAKRFFFIEEYFPRFQLINCDAFDYVKTTEDIKFNIIFVDIFSGTKINYSIFNIDFLNSLYHLSDKQAVTIINLLDSPYDEIKENLNYFDLEYESVSLLFTKHHMHLVLVKSNSFDVCNLLTYFDSIADIEVLK